MVMEVFYFIMSEFANEIPVGPEEALDYPDTPDQDDLEGLGAPGDAPRTGAEAIDMAKQMSFLRTYVGVGYCLKTVRGYYGVNAKYGSAEEGWYASKHKHEVPSSQVPRGVPVWWTNGKYGHVAISLGNGLCYSTDWKEPGRIDVLRCGQGGFPVANHASDAGGRDIQGRDGSEDGAAVDAGGGRGDALLRVAGRQGGWRDDGGEGRMDIRHDEGTEGPSVSLQQLFAVGGG